MKRQFIGVSISLGMLIGSVSADMCIVQKLHSDPFTVAGTSVPAKDDQSTTWFSGDKMCINSGKDTSMIMRLDKNIMYTIYNKEKKYSELALDVLQKRMDEVKSAADANGAAAAAMAMMKFSATVTETAETKTIGKWKCKKYVINMTIPMGSTVTEMWSTTDFKFDYSLLAKLKNGFMSSMPGFPEMIKEFSKIKGFPVISESNSTMMGMQMKNKEELIDATEKPAPAGLYDIPAGYKKQNIDK